MRQRLLVLQSWRAAGKDKNQTLSSSTKTVQRLQQRSTTALKRAAWYAEPTVGLSSLMYRKLASTDPRVMMCQWDTEKLLTFEHRFSEKVPESQGRTIYQERPTPPEFHSHALVSQGRLSNNESTHREIEQYLEPKEEADRVKDTSGGFTAAI